MNGQNPREIAAGVLGQRRPGGEFTEDLLERALAGARLSSADRGLCQEIVYGIVRWQAALDWLIARKTGGREQKPGLQNLLRLGLYQIFWLDRIPDHAAVHETVELAKHGGFGQQAGFVNAILRGYLRETDATRKLLADLKATDPATGCSHPEWLVARWQKHFGADKTAQLLEWNNTPPKTFARVNTLAWERRRFACPLARGKRRIRFCPARLARGKSGLRAEIASIAEFARQFSRRLVLRSRPRHVARAARAWRAAR
jgi:16S rRNA (cytosine967-C5)-methyltransferase